jgi:hypothetical protein
MHRPAINTTQAITIPRASGVHRIKAAIRRNRALTIPTRAIAEHTRRAAKASAFHAISAQLLRLVKRSVGPGEGLDDGLARPVLCHPD